MKDKKEKKDKLFVFHFSFFFLIFFRPMSDDWGRGITVCPQESTLTSGKGLRISVRRRVKGNLVEKVGGGTITFSQHRGCFYFVIMKLLFPTKPTILKKMIPF